ncbi:MAG: NAD(P)/FAD-dependent oxidoreductase, partial [Candidatus Omnitrophota bacterium]
MSHIKNQYDAVIIGAGVGGLVCGCYLVKAGMKVLIVEKNARPGGYCSSFLRNGFSFDACVHSLGSLRKDGIIKRVLQELNVDTSFTIKRYEPSDIIVSLDYKVCFWNELNRTIQEFQNSFPKDAKHIEKLFNFFVNCQGAALNSLRKSSFEKILNEYFIKDKKLQAIISLPVLGNIGLSASRVSAFTATALYREFIFDGGYYPEGSMQVLPDALMERFKTLGGDVLLSNLVNGISVKNNEAIGIILNEDKFISARYVISAADARQTFLKLLGKSIISRSLSDKLNKPTHSLSMFVLYLGLNKTLSNLPPQCSNLWSLPNYNVEGL